MVDSFGGTDTESRAGIEMLPKMVSLRRAPDIPASTQLAMDVKAVRDASRRTIRSCNASRRTYPIRIRAPAATRGVRSYRRDATIAGPLGRCPEGAVPLQCRAAKR